MINIEDLRDEREQGFKIWFDRWWDEQDIQNKIIDRNAAGYVQLMLDLSDKNCSDYLRNRFRDPLFIKRIESKLPGFKIQFDPIRLLSNELRLIISWAVEEEDF